MLVIGVIFQRHAEGETLFEKEMMVIILIENNVWEDEQQRNALRLCLLLSCNINVISLCKFTRLSRKWKKGFDTASVLLAC